MESAHVLHHMEITPEHPSVSSTYQPYRRPSSQEYHLNIHLKPMLSPDAPSYDSRLSTDSYQPLRPIHTNDGDDAEIRELEAKDEKLKTRIRQLKLLSRIVATILSFTTLVPISMTLIKFLETRYVTYTVKGKERTAWAKDTITWYTYMYFGVSMVSFLLNCIIMVAYLQSLRRANTAANVAGWFTGTVFFAHVVVWAASAGLYRHGKEPVDGKFRDLWGWTCSTSAQELQAVLTDVDFKKYCSIQSYSWYSGLANTGGGILVFAVYIAAIVRMRSKKTIKKASTRAADESREPLREM
ncbi:Hypothetical protein R9X50_00070700 [Acrodontium crateriforme]|uniref:Uncharacterized protein n=1 Tax=Acrodontium crateriforme TaxID=150365 RepID=A0AAQ3LY11_9PEZI|nr:Hypothetical protein R9X50_00070700 [Acrodontium crateriforme]